MNYVLPSRSQLSNHIYMARYIQDSKIDYTLSIFLIALSFVMMDAASIFSWYFNSAIGLFVLSTAFLMYKIRTVRKFKKDTLISEVIDS